MPQHGHYSSNLLPTPMSGTDNTYRIRNNLFSFSTFFLSYYTVMLGISTHAICDLTHWQMMNLTAVHVARSCCVMSKTYEQYMTGIQTTKMIYDRGEGGWAWASMADLTFCHGTQTMVNSKIYHCPLFHEHGKQNFVQPFLIFFGQGSFYSYICLD